jgi:thiamine monophosphate synthase
MTDENKDLLENEDNNETNEVSSSRAAAPSCGLYFAIPADFKLEEIMPKFRHVFYVTKASKYKMNMHVIEIAHEVGVDVFEERAHVLSAFAQEARYISIIRGNGVETAELAKRIGADGVILTKLEDIESCRTILGEDAIIGLRCGLSPERAQEAMDAGVDYVSFGYPDRLQLPPADLLKMCPWRDEKPVLIEGPITNDDAADFVEAGAGFLDAYNYIFNLEAGIMQGTVNMLYAIDLALGLEE